RAARKSRGGRAMTPAVAVSFSCCPAGFIPMAALTDAIRPKMTTTVSFYNLTTMASTGRHWGKLVRQQGKRIVLGRHRSGAGQIIGSKSEAIAELMLEVAQCFFRIRAAGQKTGLITSWGGGSFGFMRSLALLGPLTVPRIAQMRPTSRQRMQRLA